MSEVLESDAGGGDRTFLVTSSLEATWPADEPIVFLGEWCLRYSRRDVWSALDYSVAPYHWDDRAQIPTDLEYISDVYEALLPELAQVLNDIHGVNYSMRYWRTVVGWWLLNFAQIFFDRWQVMQGADEAYPNARMLRMPAVPAVPASSDMTEFVESITGAAWNGRLCADIAERWTNIQVYSTRSSEAQSVLLNESHCEEDEKPKSTRGPFGKRRVACDQSYLSRPFRVKLELLLWQFPSRSQTISLAKTQMDAAWRRWMLPYSGTDGFMRALSQSIPSICRLATWRATPPLPSWSQAQVP